MKNKLITILLTLSLVQTFLLPIASALIEDDVPIPSRISVKSNGDGNVEYESIIKLLTYLGITDETAMSLNMQKEVSRGYAVSAIAKMVGEVSAVSEKPYNDVNLTNENVSGIALAKMLGIAETTDTFKPDAVASGTDVAIWMLKALGYSKLISTEDSLSYAISLGIFEGVPSYDTLTYEEFFLVLENALNTSPLNIKFSSEGVSVTEDSDKTFLSERKGIILRKGIVTGVGTASYDDYRNLKENQIEIDKDILTINFSVGMEFLGKKVYAYVDTTDDNNEIVCIWENNNKEWKINAEDIEKVGDDKLTYYNDNDKLQNLKVSDNTKVFFNDCWYADYINAQSVVKSADYIVAVDNNKDGIIDLIRGYDSQNYVVNSFSELGRIITYKNGFGSLKANDDDVINIVIDGKQVGLADLKTNDVITVTKVRKSDDSYVYNIKVSRKNISGALRGIGEDDKGKYYIVDSDKYYITEEYEKYLTDNLSDEKPKLSSQCVFYLNIDDEIVYSKVSGDYEYGYLISAYADDENEAYFIKLYTISGEFERFKIKNKVKYFTSLYQKGISLQDETFYKDITENETKTPEPGLIAYKLDAEGCISEFVLPIDKVGETPGTTDYPLVKNYVCGLEGTAEKSRLYVGFITSSYNVSGTKAFVVPSDKKDISDEKKYKIMPSLSSYGNDYYFEKERVELYNVDKFFQTGIAAVKTTSVLSSGIDMFYVPVMISKIQKVIDADDMPVTEISFLSNGALTTKRISEEAEIVGGGNGGGWIGTEGGIEDLGVGDIIQYDVDTAGDISLIRRLFKYKNPGNYRIQGGDNKEAESPIKENRLYGISICYGIVTDKSSDVILVDVSDETNGKNIVNNYVTTLYNPNTYVLLDTKRMTVSPATYSEIMQGDTVVIRRRYNAACDMFIIR